MKNNFKLNKIIFILFIILGVFLVNNVYALSTHDFKKDNKPSEKKPKPENNDKGTGYYIHDDRCNKDSGDNGCVPLCSYVYRWKRKYSLKKDLAVIKNGQTQTMFAYITIYYKGADLSANTPPQWMVNFTSLRTIVANEYINNTYYPDKYRSTDYITSDTMFYGDYDIHWQTKKFATADTFQCPTNVYPDWSYLVPLFNGEPEVCIDRTDKSCYEYSGGTQGFTKGPKYWNKVDSENGEVKIGKTYSLFSRIANVQSDALKTGEIDCTEFTKEDFDAAAFFENLVAEHINKNLLKGYYTGDTIPLVFKNHPSWTTAHTAMKKKKFDKFKKELETKCKKELDEKLDNGEITPEDYGTFGDNVDNLTPENTQGDENATLYYMNYTVKGVPIPSDPDCEAILSTDVTKLFLTVLRYIQYLGPVLVVVLSTVDFIKAAASGSPDDMKKAWNKLVKRLIAAILLFFVALITRLLLSFFDITVPENCLK